LIGSILLGAYYLNSRNAVGDFLLLKSKQQKILFLLLM